MNVADLRNLPSKAEWDSIAPRIRSRPVWPSSARQISYYPASSITTRLSQDTAGQLCYSTRYNDNCSTLQSAGRFAHFTENDDCGSYSLFLFNNGIAINAEGQGCYGNHGQTDPAGFYLASPSLASTTPAR